MFGYFLLLFIGMPLLEIAILIKLGQIIGLWSTIGLVVITGIVGASLARIQGFMVYRRIQEELAQGRMPAGELVDGLLILIGGIVLLTPGLLTDLFGFALLVPFFRSFFKKWANNKFSQMAQTRETKIFLQF
jgi:UPF0716 protein FxsA